MGCEYKITVSFTEKGVLLIHFCRCLWQEAAWWSGALKCCANFARSCCVWLICQLAATVPVWSEPQEKEFNVLLCRLCWRAFCIAKVLRLRREELQGSLSASCQLLCTREIFGVLDSWLSLTVLCNYSAVKTATLLHFSYSLSYRFNFACALWRVPLGLSGDAWGEV